MVSSHAIHYENRRTLTELLKIHPDEGPTAIQLFGQDPEIMRSAAARAAEAGADLIDLNMGCPVPKVMKTGAGAALSRIPRPPSRSRKAAREGHSSPSPSSCARRSSPAASRASRLAQRLVHDAGVAGLTFHPRSAAVRHKGTPDYDLAARARRRRFPSRSSSRAA